MADPQSITHIRISVASPDEIQLWSHGEVRSSATVDTASFQLERHGLFCERIFGPVLQAACACGAVQESKAAGTLCSQCGGAVTWRAARLRGMGHVELAAPACHPWFWKGRDSPVSLLLDLPLRALRKVISGESYAVTHADPQNIRVDPQLFLLALEEAAGGFDRLGTVVALGSAVAEEAVVASDGSMVPLSDASADAD